MIIEDVIIQDEPPARLFKFTARRYALGMVHGGVFRIGTLKGYRAAEQLDGDVADGGEGTAVLTDSRDGFRAPDNLGWAASQVIRFAHGVKGSGIRDIKFQANVDGDLYVFCMHGSSSRTCRASEKYDTCVEITNSMGFAHAPATSVRLEAAGIGKCRYIDRTLEIGGDEAPPVALLKPTRYAYQDAWRLLWRTTNRTPVEAFNVYSRDAASFCKIARFTD